MKMFAVTALAAVVLAGCSHADTPRTHPRASVSTALIGFAAMDCDVPVPDNPNTGLTVTTCRYQGMQAIVIRFPDAAAQARLLATIQSHSHGGDTAWYALGYGWIAGSVNGVDSQHVARVFADQLGGNVSHS